VPDGHRLATSPLIPAAPLRLASTGRAMTAVWMLEPPETKETTMTYAAIHAHPAHPKHNIRHIGHHVRRQPRRAIATLRFHPPCIRG
jgi:hypothetical protein